MPGRNAGCSPGRGARARREARSPSRLGAEKSKVVSHRVPALPVLALEVTGMGMYRAESNWYQDLLD